MTRIVDHGPSLQVLIHANGDDAGIAEVIFGPAGAMPVTDAQGHAALATLWMQLAAEPGVRCVLVRSIEKRPASFVAP